VNDEATQPDWGEAVVVPAKLVEYALNASHPRGRDKARVFRSALGFDDANVEDLAEALRQGVLRHPAREAGRNAFGTFFRVDIDVTGPSGASGTIRTIWIVELASSAPRLVTLYVRRRR
jgi:hypothetical protein